MATDLRQMLLEARENPHARRILDLIAAREGVQHGYNTLFGNTRFESLDDHPRKLVPFSVDGKKNKTSAAGRYQFTQDSWDDIKRQLKSDSFSPLEQDLGALYLIHRRGALEDVLSGDYQTALPKMGPIWAALSTSHYGQAAPDAGQKEVTWLRHNPLSNYAPGAVQQLAAGVEEWIPPAKALNLQQGARTVDDLLEFTKSAAEDPSLEGALPEELLELFQSRRTTPRFEESAAEEIEDSLAAEVEQLMMEQREPSALSQLLDQLNAAQAQRQIEQEDDTLDWERDLMFSALDSDVEAMRQGAVDRFLGEPGMTRIRLPDIFEKTIEDFLRNA